MLGQDNSPEIMGYLATTPKHEILKVGPLANSSYDHQHPPVQNNNKNKINKRTFPQGDAKENVRFRKLIVKLFLKLYCVCSLFINLLLSRGSIEEEN